MPQIRLLIEPFEQSQLRLLAAHSAISMVEYVRRSVRHALAKKRIFRQADGAGGSIWVNLELTTDERHALQTLANRCRMPISRYARLALLVSLTTGKMFR